MQEKRLQVFVSSTFKDLIEERQAAVAALLKSGNIPAGMELFTAADKTQMDTIRDWIDQSDVYMLILGGRYGSIEPTTGRSYTELEYDYAVAQNKPYFAVVINESAIEEKVKTFGLDAIERDNPALLREFREKVLSNISSFFSDEKDIRICVYESLANFSQRRELIGWIRGNQAIDPSPFIQQNERLLREADELRAQISSLEEAGKHKTTKVNDSFQSVATVLGESKVTVPANCSPDRTDWETTVFDLISVNAKFFMGGITNRAVESEIGKFFYWNVCPILAVHDIMKNSKVSGNVRIYEITQFGRQFLAWIDTVLKTRVRPKSVTAKDEPASEKPSTLTPPSKDEVRKQAQRAQKTTDE
jgi:hypothetical protein